MVNTLGRKDILVAGKRVKVLQFTIAASKGGRTQFILNQWRAIDKEKFQFDFITFSSSLDFADELLREGCKIFYLTCNPEKNEEKFREEFTEILKNEYDVIHVHTSFWRGMLVEHMAKEYGVKNIIIHSHSSGITGEESQKEEEAYETHYRIRKLLTDETANYFCGCSKIAADWLYGEQISKSKIKILHNGIDTKRFAFQEETRKELRNLEGIQNEFVIGHVGRLEPMKNHKFMLEVFAEVIKKNRDFKLWIVGDGTQRQEIERLIKEYHLEAAVKMFGRRTDVDVLMQAMDCLVLPSKFEGFPIVLVEACAAGLQCVVSDAVTQEVREAGEISFLQLKKDDWVSHILHMTEECKERKNGEMLVKQAGLDVKQQVKLLEAMYEGR